MPSLYLLSTRLNTLNLFSLIFPTMFFTYDIVLAYGFSINKHTNKMYNNNNKNINKYMFFFGNTDKFCNSENASYRISPPFYCICLDSMNFLYFPTIFCNRAGFYCMAHRLIRTTSVFIILRLDWYATSKTFLKSVVWVEVIIIPYMYNSDSYWQIEFFSFLMVCRH